MKKSKSNNDKENNIKWKSNSSEFDCVIVQVNITQSFGMVHFY